MSTSSSDSLLHATFTAPDMVDEPGNRHSVAALRSTADIRQVDTAVQQLTAERHITLNSQFFLASLSPRWVPCVVAVRRGDDLVGVVCAKERTIACRSTGIVYIDGRLGELVADTADEENVMTAALNVLAALPLIETLIKHGSKELLFWSGSAPPLSRYTADLPAIRVHLDRSTPGWRLIRSVIQRTQPLMSRWITADMGWV